MVQYKNHLLDILATVTEEAINTSNYTAGLADGLKAASNIIQNDSVGQKQQTSNPPSSYRASRHPTQRPVIDALKLNGPMTVTDIMKWARSQGHDLLRPTVRDVLERLEKRGLVAANKYHYQLLSPPE